MLMLQPATSCGTISRSVSRTQRGRMHRMVSSPPASRVTLRSSCRQADDVHIIDYCRSFRVCNTVYDVVSCGRCTFSSSHVWMRFASTRHSVGKGLCQKVSTHSNPVQTISPVTKSRESDSSTCDAAHQTPELLWRVSPARSTRDGLHEQHCEKTVSLLSFLPMFVLSLSWENDHLEYKK